MLTPRPITQRAAHAFIRQHHRKLPPPVGEVLRVALVDTDGEVRAVATAGRPVARHLDDGLTLEVTRVASDGHTNACSQAYGALRRAAVALGYLRLVTYSLPDEGGASLRAAGWRLDGDVRGRQWSCATRERQPSLLAVDKWRWVWP
jgi:hypothetical protein